MSTNKPELRFPEIEGVWNRKSLGEIGEIITGSTPPTLQNEYYSGDYLFVSPYDINESRWLNQTKTTLTELGFSKGRKIEAGSTLFVCIGSTIGKVVQIKNECITNQQINSLISIGNNKDFIYTLLEYHSSKIKKLAAEQAVPIINKTTFSKYILFIPSLPEQYKIASFFTAMDEKLTLLRKKKNLLEKYKKGVMQKIFAQKLKFKDDDGNEFPEWEEKRLSSFMAERNIQEPKNEKYPLMAFVANKGVTHKGDRYNREFLVNDEENKKYKQTEFGDFIYSSNNLETGSIGLNKYGSASISPVYSIFKIKELCNYQFISSFFTSKEFIGKMIRYRQGVVYGQWRIHETAFLQIKVKLPSLDEQTKIANFLTAIDEKIESVSKQIKGMEEWKKGLMQKMFC